MRLRAALAALAGVFCLAAASDPAERLPDPGQEAQARAIFRDVRCLVCQNESIDDSEAELAHDLRQIVREQVKAGGKRRPSCSISVALDENPEGTIPPQSGQCPVLLNQAKIFPS